MKAVVLDPKDNVGVALADLQNGELVSVRHGTQEISVQLQEAISYQHKMSITEIREGDVILKYGEPIGKAVADIHVGEHVHTHNMTGIRARVEAERS